MTLTELANTITTAAQSAVPGLHPYPTEDTAAVLPALVVGWPSSIELNASMGGGREIALAVALYVPVAGGEANALTALSALIDGPLIDALNAALQPAGLVLSIGQVTPVTVASANALRVPLNIEATI